MDGLGSDLPFLLFEVWGRPQAVVEAIDVLARRRKDEAETLCVNLLLPESRLWKVDLFQMHQFGGFEVSSSITITDPMPCRTLTLQVDLVF